MNQPLTAAIALALSAHAAVAAVRYVNPAASGANNGTTWTDAHTDLHAALATASSGDEIWVVRGIYKPTTGIDRNTRFLLNPDVKIRGGFVGTETILNQRPIDPDPVGANPAHDTILSGDIGAPGFGDNSHRILELLAPGDPTLVERIVLTGAESSATIDGALVMSASVPGTPTIRDCLIVTNRSGRGAGVNISSARAAFENCNLIDNVTPGDTGGAVNAFASPSLAFSYCLFQSNSAGFVGGGAVQAGGSTVSFTGCTFVFNTAQGEGGAVRISDFPSPSVASFTDCNFSLNTSLGTNTGGAVLIRNSSGTFANCYIARNTAAQGGAIGGQNAGSITIDDCTLFDNTANFGGALYPSDLTVTITDSLFNSNQAGAGGAIESSFGATLNISSTDFFANQSTSSSGGALSLSGGSVTAKNSRFQSNTSVATGGAIAVAGGSPRFLNCQFIANSSLSAGAGVIVQAGSPVFAGCVFRNNTAASFGSAFSASGASAGGSIVNCTIINNTSDFAGCAVRASGPLTIANCIIRDNTAPAQIDGTNFAVSYSNTTQTVAGVGNINADPLFSAASLGQFSLTSGSPCIDAGDSSAVPADLLEDPVSNPRRVNDPATADTGAGPAPRVDIGAYEYNPPTGCPGDANNDSAINGADLSVLLGQFAQQVPPGSGGDFNNDGFVNGADLSVLLANFGAACQ